MNQKKEYAESVLYYINYSLFKKIKKCLKRGREQAVKGDKRSF
jgi:hypothetical protein